jgi:hypothetical protein
MSIKNPENDEKTRSNVVADRWIDDRKLAAFLDRLSSRQKLPTVGTGI